MTKPIQVDDANFEQLVLKAGKPVLVDFWATWCKPCVMVEPIVDELAAEFNGRIDFVKIDTENNPKTPARYSVMSLPTLLVFKNGEPVSHMVGLKQKSEIKKNLESALG
ncbi:thioredoxin [Chloroflexota bacterium]